MTATMTDTTPQGVPDKPWKAPTAQEVMSKQKKVEDDMLDTRRNYLLNSAFLHGDQWVRWDDSVASVNIVPFLSDQEGQARSTVNKLKPLFTSLHARLCKAPLGFEVQPEGIDSFAIQKARLVRQVLDVKSHRDGWPQQRRILIRDLMLGGVSAIVVEPAYDFEQEEIIDPSTNDRMKVPSRPAPKIRALSACEFGLEPGTSIASEALWGIIRTTLTPEQAKRRYELNYTPAADAEAMQSAMQRALRSNRRGSTIAKGVQVLVYYERPTSTTPGCVVHVLNDKIVQQHDWPFPFQELNITPFIESEIGGTWKGDTRMNDARQLQVQINKAYTSINACLGRTDNARLLVPEGAILDGEDEFTGTQGEVIRYNTEQGAPHWMEAPQIARWLREHIDNLGSELDDLFNTHAVSQGRSVGSRISGMALSILVQQDDTPLGLVAGDQQRGWQRVAEQVLMLERHLMNLVEENTGTPMRVSGVLMRTNGPIGQGEAHEVSWSADDIPEHPVVNVPINAVMPKSQAATQDAMLKLASSFPTMFQQLTPQQLATTLMVDDPAAFARVSDPHVENAIWENARMANGDDETVVKIEDWQPHAVHVKYHNEFRASAGYRDADQQIQQFIDLHVQAHEKLLLDEYNEQVAAQQQGLSQPPPEPGGSPAPGAPAPPPQGVAA